MQQPAFEKKRGRDVSALVRDVLQHDAKDAPSRLTDRLRSMLAHAGESTKDADYHDPDPSRRIFRTRAGMDFVQLFVGDPAPALDALSVLSVELVFEFLDQIPGFRAEQSRVGRRFLTVPGAPNDPPALLILDPAVQEISESKRITDEIDLDPKGLVLAYDKLRPALREAASDRAAEFLASLDAETVIELLWIAQPQVIVTRRPNMIPLSAPSPFLAVQGRSTSTVGVFCRDVRGQLGVTACYHGTGPIGTHVAVAGVPSTVDRVDVVQDMVFIPVGQDHALPPLSGRSGVREGHAPSEAEPVAFEGAGSGARVATRVKSHDAGILRKRPTVQLKLQTPADTNSGDSGAALIDASDRVVGFAFERTGVGEFPELTDWIWAANAMPALGLTPI